MSKPTMYCSFCGKSQHEVRKLIAGPEVSSAMNAWLFVTRSFVTRARLDAGCAHLYESLNVGASKKICPRNRTFHVRFGSKADICSAKRHVCFTPESGHVQRNYGCPLRANSGHRPPAQPFRSAGLSWYDPIHLAGWLHEAARVHCTSRWCWGGVATGCACTAAEAANDWIFGHNHA
jgi:ClpX C4-type zinc finger